MTEGQTRHPNGKRTARYVIARLPLALGLIALTFAPATAQEQPALLPISPPRLASVFPVAIQDTLTDQFDLSLSVLDYAPGSATRAQSRHGQLFGTVMEGEITLNEGGDGTAYVKGQKFVMDPNTFGSLSNASDSPARVFITVLSDPGAVDEVDQPDSPVPGQLPTVMFTGRTTVAAPQGEFRLSQGIYDFVTGAGSGAHSHGGPGIVIVMAGEMTQRIPGQDVQQDVGDVFTEVSGRAVDHRNLGTQTATVAVSYLIPVGPPFVIPATLPGSPPLLAQPPATPSPTPAR